METVFKLKAKELDNNFLNAIKSLFKKDEDIQITISSNPCEDETEYLMKNPVMRSKLLEAIEEIKQNKNLVSFTGEEFEEYSKKLLKK